VQQYAKVIKVKPEMSLATVEIKRHASCDKCGECSEQPTAGEMEVDARNPIGAQKGDFVAIEMDDRSILGALVVVYLVPIINMFIGYFLGEWLSKRLIIWNPEMLGAVMAISFLVISFGIAKKYGEKGKAAGRYQPVIKRTVDLTVEDIEDSSHHQH
jgi:sigma-E factor negative regulatory protein RseC